MSAKQIVYSEEGHKVLREVGEILGKTVGVTLGPKGHTVLVDASYGSPKVTKDGVTVAKAITLPGNLQNMIAQAMIQPAIAVAGSIGDGTTTVTVLLASLIAEAGKYVAAGMDSTGIARGMNKCADAVIEELSVLAKDCNDLNSIKQVAGIASNNDNEIGEYVGTATQAVGAQGVIRAEAGDGRKTVVKTVEGMQLDRGYTHHGFARDAQTIVLDNARVLIVDKKISGLHEILGILEKVMQASQPLLIIAEDIEGDALGALILNNARGTIKNCAIKAPGFGDNRKEQLQDIAVLTKAEVISEELGLTVAKATLDQLGTTKRVIIDKDTCTIIAVDEGSDKSPIEARIQFIEEQKRKSTTPYEIEKYQERLAKLSGGVALIKVGASTETEMEEKQARVQDALSAVRAAVEEGIVPGGGIALLRASKVLENFKGANADEDAGIAIVKRALRAPLYKIAENAGVEAPLIAHEVLHSEQSKNPNYGYNAASGKYGDMVEMGIIDPKKVTRVALEKAVSIASVLITSACMIVDLPKNEDSSAGNPGGMGGMGGMDMM